jgi:hypothetical protein
MTDPYKQVTSYDMITGRLINVCTLGVDSLPEAGQAHLAGHSDLSTQYYNIAEDTIAMRLPLGASLSAYSVTLGDSVTLAPLPIPCTVRVSGVAEPVVVDDGSLEVTPASIGDNYRMTVDEVTYLRESWFFEVTE